MPQSLAKVLIHLVFSTTNRAPMIHHAVRSDLHAYVAGILQNLDCPPVQIGGTADHVHALFSLTRTLPIARVVEEMKKSSSKWMKRKDITRFAWQAGYGVFSVSSSQSDQVVKYIATQEEHHRIRTFQEEVRGLLDRHGVSFDERYLWD